ncbi:MAG TPA: ribose-phosphate diphosphokinase [Anaerolineae bacterium]|nr:ribose-phosphate diphosphokinase [Anaerolineae bacterium]
MPTARKSPQSAVVEVTTSARFADEHAAGSESSRGRLLLASCRSGSYLARRVAAAYERQTGETRPLLHLENIDHQFSDGETNVRLEQDVNGCDVFLLQGLYDPTSQRGVDENYLAFLIAARALQEWGANYVTAVLPYLAYARQDKPTKFEREPTTAKLMADLSIEAGIDRLVVWHPHYQQTHGFYGKIPVDVLDGLNLFIEQFQPFAGRPDVIAVAPDAGASKFVTHFSRALNLNSAIASKYRPRPEEAVVSEIIGDFSDKRIAIVLDDMVSSGGTIYALIKKLVDAMGIEEVYLAASHNLGLPSAGERLAELHANYHLKQVIFTNSIPPTEAFQRLPFVQIHCLADTLSQVVNRIHYNRSVSDLFYNHRLSRPA